MFQGLDKQNIRKGAIENRDRFAAAPPGISLTSDNSKWPWGNPPEEVDPDTVLETATAKLDNDPMFKDEMMKLLLAGVSVEHIVETWLIDGFENGRFSLDAGLLAKGQVGVYIAYLADKERIPYRMFEKDHPTSGDRLDDVSYFELMRTNNPAMFSKIREGVNLVVRKGMEASDRLSAPDVPVEAPTEQLEPPAQEGFMDRGAPIPDEIMAQIQQPEEEGM